jgi:Ferritin-like domain
MKIQTIINAIEIADKDVQDRFSPRRKVLKDFFNMGAKFTVAALPLAFGSLLAKAYGKVPDAVLDVLNFGLSLEYFEFTYYDTALKIAGLVNPKDNLGVIRDHERQHVHFLTEAIKASGGTPVTIGKYDFTAKGTFPDVFSNYKTFLHVAQAFEDTGVRAYKGQAGNLLKAKPILQAALQLHSVEARHAGHIRFARRMNGFDTNVRPWIVGDENSKGTPLAAVYKGESNHIQAGVDISQFKVGDADTSGFDEPLSKDEVLAIVKPFWI